MSKMNQVQYVCTIAISLSTFRGMQFSFSLRVSPSLFLDLQDDIERQDQDGEADGGGGAGPPLLLRPLRLRPALPRLGKPHFRR